MTDKHGCGGWGGGVDIRAIPHDKQRYETCGDWSLIGKTLHIMVSNTGNTDYNFLLAIHELVEALVYMYKRNFAPDAQRAVDEHDKAYELRSEASDGPVGDGEPGAEPLAPYYSEHMLAMAVEHLVAQQLGVDWNLYTEALAKLEH